MLVLGVALLAAFIFIGGGAAIYLSTPPQPQQSFGLIGDTGTPGPSLADFTQETPSPQATPAPTPTPFFFSPDPGSFTPLPTDLVSPTPSLDVTPTPTTSGPTPTPRPTPKPTPTPTATPAGPHAAFTFAIAGNTVQFTDKSTGDIVSWHWDFGDGQGKGPGNSPSVMDPKHTFKTKSTDQTYTVILTVTDSNGVTDVRMKDVTIPAVTVTPPPTQPPATTPPPATESPSTPSFVV